jgi:phage shock protein A
MADSLKNRVSRVIASGVNALLDHIEDLAPDAVMEQAIREADKVIDEVRHELGKVSANRHLAQQQHSKLNQEHSTLGARINEALAGQREDLASTGVARQLDIEAQLPVLETTLSDLARNESELDGYIAALLAKKREMEEAVSQYRKSRAIATAPTAGGPASTADARMAAATSAFDRVYERQTGLPATARGASLTQGAQLKELEDLSRRNKIDERLAQLKGQLQQQTQPGQVGKS